MDNNIILTPGGPILIINGGNPINDCPQSWDVAYAIEARLNAGKEDGPQWDFDCGFKLDYDGGILTISSRFYPPKTHFGPTWDGTMTVYLLGEEIASKSFDCKTLDELKAQVDEYVNSVVAGLRGHLSDNPPK